MTLANRSRPGRGVEPDLPPNARANNVELPAPPAPPRQTASTIRSKKAPADGPSRLGRFVDGAWSVEGDELVKDGLKSGGVHFGNPEWTDFDLSFEARKTAGPEGLGITFRESDGKAHYWLFLGGSQSNQRHVIGRWSRSIRNPIVSEIQWRPGGMELREWYKVNMSMRGEKIRVTVVDL